MEVGRVRRLVGFGGSHFGRTLTWVAADVYALYALTTVAGLSTPEAAAVFLGTMAFSAVADLGVGWSLDRWGVPRAVVLVSAAIVSSA